MSGFSAGWLALREPFDQRARAAAWPALGPALATWRATLPPGQPIDVLDLACGTGANLRALAPRLGGRQRWRLLDHDPALLAALPAAMANWAQEQGLAFTAPTQHARGRVAGAGFDVELGGSRLDLVQDRERLDLEGAQLVTASALLDLVSEEWLDALLDQATRSRCALLFALSVDGRTQWSPGDEADETVHHWFSAHQRRDKGFGPSLGPAALPRARQALEAAGYTCVAAPSAWHIGPGEPLQAAMAEGMAQAAREQAEDGGAADALRAIDGWQARRVAAAATSRLVVGHQELLALPALSAGRA